MSGATEATEGNYFSRSLLGRDEGSYLRCLRWGGRDAFVRMPYVPTRRRGSASPRHTGLAARLGLKGVPP